MKKLLLATILIGLSGLTYAYLRRPDRPSVIVVPPPPIGLSSEGFELSNANLSFYSLPVQLPISEAQRIANADTPRNFKFTAKFPVRLEKRVLGKKIVFATIGVDAAFDVNRGDINLSSVDGNRLSYSIPISGRVVFHAVKVQDTLVFDGHIDGSTGAALRPDWSVSGDTNPTLSLRKAELKILGVPVSVRGRAEEEFRSKAPSIVQHAFASALAQLPVRKNAQLAWDQLHLSRQLANSPAVWLNLLPKQISVKPISTQNGMISTAVSISAATTSYVAKAAPPVAGKESGTGALS